MEGALLAWSEFAKGFLHGSPMENRLTFKLWLPGHNKCVLKRYLYDIKCDGHSILNDVGSINHSSDLSCRLPFGIF